MALKKIFCPNCGNETQLDETRPFCFCLECGQKIQLVQHSDQSGADVVGRGMKEDGHGEGGKYLDEKLKEVEFYYNLSYEKKEAGQYDSEPIYYLKAQDLLVDLSQQYPEDYRIWKELSKPIDYRCADSGMDIENRYSINEDYFNKALDLAELSVKRSLIDEHDKYIKNKKEAYERAREVREAKERERNQKLMEEEIRRQKELEEQYKKQEEARQLALAEQIETEQREREALKRQLEKEGKIINAVVACEALFNKDYSILDDKYFEMKEEDNQKIIGVFKQVSNLLYLMSFRIQLNKGNAVYRDQSVSILFDSDGHVMKYDRKPLKIKGLLPPDDVMLLENDSMGRLCINGMELKKNEAYIKEIIKRSKKPILAFSKTFL